MVDAVEVVEARVGVELAFEAAQTRLHVTGEGGSPALVEDRLVQGLDVAIGLWATGMDAGVTGAQVFHHLGELAPELVAVVGGEAPPPPPGSRRMSGAPPREL